MAAHLCQQLALFALLFLAPCLGRRLHSAGAHNSSSIQAEPAPAPAPDSAPAAAQAPAAPQPADPCSWHFNDYCTCGATLRYLQHVSQICMQEGCKCDEQQFSTTCGQMASLCKENLDVTCSMKEAKCSGKYHQGTDGVIGLTINYDKLESKAYCGPHGNCMGEVIVAVNIHRPAAGVRLDCAMETHAGTVGTDAGTEQMAMLSTKRTRGGRLATNSSKKLEGCGETVTGPQATCTMPMPKELPSGDQIEGLCRLVEEQTGRILTKDAWFKLSNPATYTEPKANPAKPPDMYKYRGKGDPKPAAKGGAAPWASALALALSVAAAA